MSPSRALARLAGASLAAALLAAPAPPVSGAREAGTGAALRASADAERADADYRAALALIDAGRYAEALGSLRRLQNEHPAFERMAAVQTRVAVLQEAGGGAALALLLEALERRDAGDAAGAARRLATLVERHPQSDLVDDALYLDAYFAVMDRYDFAAARTTLLELGRRFPDTAYRDSAVYLDAIALEQLGRTDAARTALTVLRERHTALALPLGFRWPAGGMLSRYWFDRAERRLGIIERRLDAASTLGTRALADDGRLRIDVSLGGMDMTLLLSPSPLVRDTAWLDAGLADRAPPAVGVYEGTVLGQDGSWVRAVVRDESITGLVEIDGTRHRLLPANLIGTLDYYAPKPRGTSAEGDGSSLAELLRGHDALEPPPALGGARPGPAAARGPLSDVRAVPLSIVVDSQYDRYHAGAGAAAALNDLNVADGIYRDFGLSLVLDEVLVFDGPHDPMALGTVSLETLLRRFRNYRLARSTLFEGSALTYLFSGNPRTDVTLGLAWIDTLCRTDGYDVGVTTPSAFGDVLVTHELGHSLGAKHDSDTECGADAGYLMWPNISEHTPTTLSPCSESSVRRAHARSCLLDTVDLILLTEAAADGVRFHMSNTDGALGVDATLLLESGAARRDWPAGCAAQTPSTARCRIDALGPGETRTLLLPYASDGDGTGDDGWAAGGELWPVGVTELAPEDNVVTGDVPSLAGAPPASGTAGAGGAGGGALVDATHAAQGAERPALGGGNGGGGGGGLSPATVLLAAVWLRCRRHGTTVSAARRRRAPRAVRRA